MTSLGDVIRDHEGTVIACWAMGVRGGFLAAVGELLAIWEGLQVVAVCNLKIDLIESDAINVVQAFLLY